MTEESFHNTTHVQLNNTLKQAHHEHNNHITKLNKDLQVTTLLQESWTSDAKN